MPSMNMKMEQYWPQHKLFLFGQCALFPEKLEGRCLSKDELAHCIPAYSSTSELIAYLEQYEQDGYFKIEIMLDSSYLEWERNQAIMASRTDPLYSDPHSPPDLGEVRDKVTEQAPLTTEDVRYLLKPALRSKTEQYLRFKITNIDKNKFYDELAAYLTKYQQGDLTTGTATDPESFENQQLKLWGAVAKDTEHGDKPTIKQTDIWQTPTGHETFWELILTCQLLTSEMKIANMGYNDTPTRVLATGISSVAHAGTVPFAKIVVKTKPKQAATLHDTATSTAQHHARIVMSDTGLIEIKLDNDTKYPVKKVRYEGAPYNFFRYILDNPSRIIDITEIHDRVKGCKAKKNMTELARQCGFSETLKVGFFTGTSKEKVRLTQDVTLSSMQLDLLKNDNRKQS